MLTSGINVEKVNGVVPYVGQQPQVFDASIIDAIVWKFTNQRHCSVQVDRHPIPGTIQLWEVTLGSCSIGTHSGFPDLNWSYLTALFFHDPCLEKKLPRVQHQD
ncbi:MAG TPA: hypothetical protein VNO69_10255 [Methyloceanibacter sp.]|nr:hypothetical protein [Methyloceanibacter sp.]